MRLSILVVVFLLSHEASALSLADAEQLAIESDPQLQALAERSTAQEHLAVADSQLPDPRIRLGAQPVPLPSFDVRDEPMTQFQLGLEQQVPARSRRRAAARRAESESDALILQSRARELELRHAVRSHWVAVVRLQALIDLTLERVDLLDRYSDALDNGLQNGRVSQQVLLEGRTRAIRVQRDLARLRVQESEHRAALRALVADRALPMVLDSLETQASAAWMAMSITRFTAGMTLDRHPAVLAAAARATVAEADIGAAQAAFDPNWSWSIGVGRRIGDTPQGAPDDTLLSAQLSIELPLFTEKRQSQRLTAARASHRAALTRPVDVERGLRVRQQSARVQAQQYAELETVYARDILPPTLAAAAAAGDKYRNGSIPQEDVLAAEIEILDVRHEQIEALLELDRARIELAFLEAL